MTYLKETFPCPLYFKGPQDLQSCYLDICVCFSLLVWLKLIITCHFLQISTNTPFFYLPAMQLPPSTMSKTLQFLLPPSIVVLLVYLYNIPWTVLYNSSVADNGENLFNHPVPCPLYHSWKDWLSSIFSLRFEATVAFLSEQINPLSPKLPGKLLPFIVGSKALTLSSLFVVLTIKAIYV
jgi:hypothetical protein